VRDDDELIAAYEADFDEPPRRRSNRGFWIVAGTLLVACVVLVVEIFANLGLKDTVAHAQFSLRQAQAAAEGVRVETGSFVAADASGLAARVPERTFVGPDQASAGLDDLSVWATERGWAAAVSARPGACFYLRLDSSGEESFGAGTTCTGTAASEASDSRW